MTLLASESTSYSVDPAERGESKIGGKACIPYIQGGVPAERFSDRSGG